jgi:hypothetical protein
MGWTVGRRLLGLGLFRSQAEGSNYLNEGSDDNQLGLERKGFGLSVALLLMFFFLCNLSLS